jgi:hypothetical protein
MVHGHRHVKLEVGVYAQDHRNLRFRPLDADRPHLISSLRCRLQLPPEERERTDDTVRGLVRGELL